MQTLAQNGNGTAAYIDTLNEARKVLVEEASSTLFPIAKDVKIQVEFNPAEVSEYRLVGYETRALRREDFNNDKVDAGDVGSGHAVTAVYDITPVGKKKLVDDLRYGQPQADAAKSEPVANAKPGELGFLKLRYKLPREDKSRLIEVPIRSADAVKSIDAASKDVRFAMAVATFGQMLKGGNFTGTVSYDDVIALATKAKGDDPFGLRAEFVNLVRLAKSVK
jgi:Ca-activated chloride channel family protein